MGIQMAIATTSSIEYIENIEAEPVKTSSVDASYSDPDLLIREYFLSSSAQRAKSRATVAQHIRGLKAVFAILSWVQVVKLVMALMEPSIF
jgi:hypothetical protein